MFTSYFAKKSFCILLVFIFSCGQNLENLTDQKSFHEIYTELKDKEAFYPKDRSETTCLHSQFLRACQNDNAFTEFLKSHVDQNDIHHCYALKNNVKTTFNQKACSYTPPHIPIKQVKDVYQLCLVPGFFIRTVDNYTPMIAREIVDFLKNKNPYCVIQSDIISRWDGYIKDHDDNLDFDTQYKAMEYQITKKTDALKKQYPNAQIHLIFAGESFGGKITLFFINKFLKNLQDNRITIDRLITVHSPLYGMSLAKYLIDNSEAIMDLYNNQAFIFLLSSIQYDFLNVLNVNHYMNTFDLLSKDEIQGVTTDEALQNLIDNKIQILNFIGTPNDVFIMGNKVQYNSILNLLNIVKCWFFKMDENGNFEKDEDGHDIFLTEKWDTLDHSFSSLSEIILKIKHLYFSDLITSDINNTFKSVIDSENVEQIKNILYESAPCFNEQMFDELKTADAIMGLAAILNDLTELFTKNMGDSDIVVKVNEITKNQDLIHKIRKDRNKTFFTAIDDNNSQCFICSPNITHAFEHGHLPQFGDDIKNFFIPYLEKTTNLGNKN